MNRSTEPKRQGDRIANKARGQGPAEAASPTRLNNEKTAALPRLAATLDEAAAMIGVSRDFLDEHVRHELRVIRRGRLRLVPVAELERWVERSASLALDDVA